MLSNKITKKIKTKKIILKNEKKKKTSIDYYEVEKKNYQRCKGFKEYSQKKV